MSNDTVGYIGQVKIGDNNYYRIGSTAFAILDSPSNGSITTTAQQISFVVPLDGFVPTDGATVHIKFVQANSVNDLPLTLKVGGDSARPIVNPNGTKTWAENSVISFTNDGTNWVMNSSQISVDASQLDIAGFGNITKEGKLSNADATISNNDQLIIVDYNDNTGRIAKASLKFDGSTTTTALTPKGTWEAFVKSVTITQGNGITVSDSGTAITGTGTRTISIGTGAITNGMLAGSIENEKLAHSSVSIAGTPVSLGGSISAATLRSNLGLTQALRFVGSTTTAMSDGHTGIPAGISIYSGSGAVAPAVGDVVLDSSNDSEYVCISVSGTTYIWERLGRDSSWALDNAVVHSSGAAGDLLYWSNTDTTSHLAGNTTSTKKFLSMTNSTPSWVTLAKGDVGLANVTNDAQVKASVGTKKGDIIYFTGSAAPTRLEIGTAGQVLSVSNDGIPTWAANQATDEKVKQSPYNTAASSSTVFNLLFKHSTGTTEETDSVYFSTISGKALTWDAYTGTLNATKFSGDGSGLTGITTNQIGGTGSGTKFLRQDGWKTLSIDNSSKAYAVTAVSATGGTAGVATTARVSDGILIIDVGTDTTFQTLNVTNNATQFLTAASLTVS